MPSSTLPAFDREEFQKTRVHLATQVAEMMGRKFEEGDWSKVYCAAKEMPLGTWSNLSIDVTHGNLGIEQKMICRRSHQSIMEACGTSIMHPAGTRAIRIPTEEDATKAARIVLQQYVENIEERTEIVRVVNEYHHSRRTAAETVAALRELGMSKSSAKATLPAEKHAVGLPEDRQCYTCQTQPLGVEPVCAWDNTPRRVWSLLEMLSIRMADYLRLAESVAEMAAVFTFTDAEEGDPGRQLTEDEKEWIKRVMKRALAIAEHINMPISRHLLREKVLDIPQNRRELYTIRSVIFMEIESKKFFFTPESLVKYYDSDDVFSERATRAFPSCRAELRFSGNCLAFSEWTAAVFHAMRAAEIGVRVLAKELGVSFPDKPVEMAEWHQLLDNADAKIKAIGQRSKSTERDADQAFFSQAAAEFRYFKDGWRVRVAHARASYSENEALKIYAHVRDFFEVLSSRLSEERG